MKTLLRSLVTISLMAAASSLQAQQDPMYSQYMFNGLAVNPAYAGVRGTPSITAMYRKQWMGIEGAPTTFTFSADAPIKNEKMALGANIVQDKIGISNTLLLNLIYAYHIRFANDGKLSLGLQAGINQFKADYSSVETSYTPGQIDAAFGYSTTSLFPNFGFGAYYYTDKFFIGAGVPKMLKNNLSGTNSPTLDFTSYPNRQNRHIFVSTGYTFDLNPDWALKPSMLFKGVHGAPLEVDVNVNAWWQEKVGAGLSYRTADALVAMVQFQVKEELQFGYAYDMTVSQFSGTNSGSHELMLRYEPFAKEAKKKQVQVSKRKSSYNKPGRKQQYKKKRATQYRRPKSR
jgi:type IX secretion system PorP/SprF family membrane protein